MGETDDAFLEIGDQLVGDLSEVAALRPDSFILDVGCGYGRVAHALLRNGIHRGRYLGIDILERHIRWCQENLATIAPDRISFSLLDIQNDRYNPQGSMKPDEVRFDVDPLSVDLVVMTSVLTHMLPAHVRHYLDEIARVLKSSGRAYVTFFLMNSSWRQLERAGKSIYPLPHRVTRFARCMDRENMLHVIAYREAWVRRAVRKAGLEVAAVRLGSWCGRPSPNGQDVLVLTPRARATS